MSAFIISLNTLPWIQMFAIALKLTLLSASITISIMTTLFALKFGCNQVLEFFTYLSICYASYLCRQSLHQAIAEHLIKSKFEASIITTATKKQNRARLETELADLYDKSK